MSRPSFLVLAAGAAGFLVSAAVGFAESGPDLVSPKLREKVVADAERIAATRGKPVELPNPLPNPFAVKEPEVVDAPAEDSAPAVELPPLNGLELLERLAAEIPATGTVFLGDEAILLLGQKKLKEGETYMISLDGQSYEVSIAAITPTSFTVKRGELRFSRPTRLPGSSTSTPSSRP